MLKTFYLDIRSPKGEVVSQKLHYKCAVFVGFLSSSAIASSKAYPKGKENCFSSVDCRKEKRNTEGITYVNINLITQPVW
jgi:hypothetical protein